MNYRQWKKMYKKKHGYNPRRLRMRYIAKKWTTAFLNSVSNLTEGLKAMWNSFNDCIQRFHETVINMSDEEFRQWVKESELTVEQVKLLHMIRGKNNDRDE